MEATPMLMLGNSPSRNGLALIESKPEHQTCFRYCWRHNADGHLLCPSPLLYTAYFRTRKSEGLITRKLSVTESRRASQFRGTSRVRKVVVFVLKSRNVA